jgi:predicted Rossmann fold nucleotide-binding protein DprA/Smf involved in DNA uptake
LPYQNTYAWVLDNTICLRKPVSYRHPRGAVIWVNLPNTVVKQIYYQNTLNLQGKEVEMTIKQDLQTLIKEIKALENKMDTLIAAVEKGEKPTTGKKTTAKPVNAKTTKRSPAKKASAKEKTAKLTATDQVLEIINGSKDGVNIKTLMEKTSFNQKKVTNILQRTYKMGKIKRVGKGIYVGA